jgi:hypothetical protein
VRSRVFRPPTRRQDRTIAAQSIERRRRLMLGSSIRGVSNLWTKLMAALLPTVDVDEPGVAATYERAPLEVREATTRLLLAASKSWVRGLPGGGTPLPLDVNGHGPYEIGGSAPRGVAAAGQGAKGSRAAIDSRYTCRASIHAGARSFGRGRSRPIRRKRMDNPFLY